MQLLLPSGLWALALVPPLVLLYFLKLKRVPWVISSSLLWRRALLDSRANAPFQRLRRNLLLLLQIAVLVFLALALARPSITVRGRAARSTVLVLDGSASMASTDVAPNRFSRAAALAGRMVGELRPEDEAMVVWAGPRPRVVAPFSRDAGSLKRALAALEPADAPGDLRGALLLALSASAGRGSREIVVLTDGAVDPLQDLSVGDAPVRFVSVGERGDNVAIVAVDVRRRSGGARQGFATVANAGGEEVAVDLEIRLRPLDAKGAELPPELLEVKPLTVPAGGERSEVFAVPDEGGLLELAVTPGGILPSDDRVYVALPARGRIGVGLAGADTALLRRALAADPRLTVREGLPAAGSASQTVGAFAGTEPASYSRGRFLVVAPVTGRGLFAVGARVEDPGPVHWEPQHSITRHTALGEAHVGVAIATTPPPGAVVLAEAGATPIVWAYERPGSRLVVLAFDPFDTDLPLRAGFPILLANAVDWLLSDAASGVRVVAAGEIARGDAPAGTETVRVVDPGGGDHALRVSTVAGAEPEWLFEGTTRAGIYRVTAGGERSSFAVNLLSRAESDVRPRPSLSLGAATVRAEEEGDVRRLLDLAPWAALLALGFLSAEWWVFHRRGG